MIPPERGDALQSLQVDLAQFQKVNSEIYCQHSMVYMMRQHNIREILNTQGQVPWKISCIFKEAFKAQITECKFTAKENFTKFMWHMQERGLKRKYKIKKFKAIGEIQILTEFLELVDSNKRAEIKRQEEEARALAEIEERSCTESEEVPEGEEGSEKGN